MSRLPVYIYEHTGRHVLVCGPIRDWLRRNGIPATRSAVERGWWIRRERLADLVAQLEIDGYTVRPRGVR
ncbi:hypothetical protein [Phycicoccus avicenniae]|uniref:hypothetical protein n=1 Tax=Phycicoccus avicenniae TaxID=2828860 RepID=UPI003D29B92D